MGAFDNYINNTSENMKIASFKTPGDFLALLMEEGAGNLMPMFGLDPQEKEDWEAFYAGVSFAALATYGCFHTNLIENLPYAIPEQMGVEVL